MPHSVAPPLPDRPEWIGVADGAALLAAGQLSSEAWVGALLARALEVAAPVAAYVNLAGEAALAAAREADRELAAGRRRGPLHGVPWAAKDLFDACGLPTTGHSRVMRDRVPVRDAPAVALLRAQGAVLLGKLATHEFAHGGPSLDLPWPPARNPWDLERFTGSSSSGSGAALAAGLVPMALGTDTGGSIRIPAGLCGVVGLKPTYGRVSRRGVYALAPTLDVAGPMARCVRDVALMLQAIAVHDPRDAGSVAAPTPDYAAALDGDLRGRVIGVPRHLWQDDLMAPPAAAAALETALQVLRARGATLREVRLRPLRQYNDVRVIVQEPEAFALFHTALIERAGEFGRDFLGRILPGCLVPAWARVQAERMRRRMTEEMLQVLSGCHALVALGAGPAPRFDAPRTHGFRHGLWSERPNLTSPYSVTGLPALSVCTGFSDDGLPLSMQIVGRPFDEATVLRIGDAHERDTGWHRRHPELPPADAVAPIALAPEPEDAPLDPTERAWVDACVAHAGLRLTDVQRAGIDAVAPALLAMLSRIERDAEWTSEAAAVFRVPAIPPQPTDPFERTPE
jgi:aspartyl-tRNA(Asn)/glutamyl-tRNA(Gln) amidotransferase subunit A